MTDRKLTEAEMISYLKLSVAIGSTARLAPEEAQTLIDIVNRQKAEISVKRKLLYRAEAKLKALQMDNAQLQSDIVNANMNADHALAEIERLKNNPTLPKSGFINLLCGALIFTETLEQYNKFRRTFKSGAVKEFAQRVKAHTRHLFSGVDVGHIVDELVIQETEERAE